MRIETRPSRLLGPAVPDIQVLARGVCPICGVGVEECAAILEAGTAEFALLLDDLHYGVSMAGAR